jgi:hypothetical protein
MPAVFVAALGVVGCENQLADVYLISYRVSGVQAHELQGVLTMDTLEVRYGKITELTTDFLA